MALESWILIEGTHGCALVERIKLCLGAVSDGGSLSAFTTRTPRLYPRPINGLCNTNVQLRDYLAILS